MCPWPINKKIHRKEVINKKRFLDILQLKLSQAMSIGTPDKVITKGKFGIPELGVSQYYYDTY